MIKFSLLEMGMGNDEDVWWFAFMSLDTCENFYHLLLIECDAGSWNFDFLWLRPLTYRIMDWWESRHEE